MYWTQEMEVLGLGLSHWKTSGYGDITLFTAEGAHVLDC
jgi:hypothetical protein